MCLYLSEIAVVFYKHFREHYFLIAEIIFVGLCVGEKKSVLLHR